MSDTWPAGRSRETTVGNQCDFSVEAFVIHDGIGCHQHFRCARAFCAFVANENDVAGFDMVMDDGLLSVFFGVKDPSRTGMVVHIRRTGRVFNDRSFRRDVAFQYRNRPFFGGIFWFTDHLLRTDFVIVEVTVVAGKEARLMEHFQVVAERTASNGKNIKIQIIAQIPLHHWHAASEPHHFGNVFTAGLNIGQIRDFVIDPIKQFGLQLPSKFMSDGRKVDHRIGAATNSSMDFDSIFKRRRSQDLMGGDIFLRQIQRLVACGSGNAANFRQGRWQQSAAWQGQPQGL
ncbi:Uncharacterised protein [Salmonella enterica subsp. enterica serovar Bovismorbificans]|uniref:Uncharacterized protein n=1 Tax=Salmonella enterica subsp. enterica serovar Bovismorbificans TaxID=58097 RepID=A0A655BY07_SALET|nr:Uncharacterised protein [Salmonella enterica subsp. enterica serovar Bovismorbificans]